MKKFISLFAALSLMVTGATIGSSAADTNSNIFRYGIDKEIIIAYEPVWAVGTNETPCKEDIKKIIKYIKSLTKYDIMVLYGGSVDSNIINNLKEVKEVSGFLIGGNSTNISELTKIKEAVN